MPEPSKPAEPRRADAQRNRDLLLDAAALVLSRDANATLADAAQQAGVSRATAYRHFADIDAARAALLEEAQEVGRGMLADALPSLMNGGEEPASVVDLIDGVLRKALPMKHRWTTAISNEPLPDDGLVAMFQPVAAAILRRGQQTGELRDDLDIDVVAQAFIALVLYAVRRVHSQGIDPGLAMHGVRPFVDGLRRPGAQAQHA